MSRVAKSENELKNCQCGSSSVTVQTSYRPDKVKLYCAKCSVCWLRTEYFDDSDDAKVAWNKRETLGKSLFKKKSRQTNEIVPVEKESVKEVINSMFDKFDVMSRVRLTLGGLQEFIDKDRFTSLMSDIPRIFSKNISLDQKEALLLKIDQDLGAVIPPDCAKPSKQGVLKILEDLILLCVMEGWTDFEVK